MTSLANARKYKNIGNEYFKKEKYDEAIAQYNKAIDICPRANANVNDLAIFYQNRAAANEQLKKYSDVKADCTKALEFNPKYMKALLRRARALKQLGDLEAALDDLTTVCIDERFSNQTTNAMTDEICEKLIKQNVQENLANNKFTMPSKEFVKKYILSFPKDPVFSRLQHPENISEFFKKPLRALKDEKYDDVIPLCTEIIQKPEFDTLPSSKLEVLLLRATFYVFFGKHDSAIQDFEKILSSEDASDDVKTNVLIKRGDLYAKLENFKMAFKDFELAINMNPNYSEIYYHRGMVYWHMDNFNGFKHDFDKAVLFNPNFCIAYIRKYYYEYYVTKGICDDFFNTDCVTVELANGIAKHVKKCFKICRSIFERSICYAFYAEMLYESRQYEKADTFLVKALKEDPENASIHVHRAILQLKWKDNVDIAVKHLNKALELDEKCEKAHKLFGYIAIQKGNVEEAMRSFDNALALCCTSTELTRIYNLIENTKLFRKIKTRGFNFRLCRKHRILRYEHLVFNNF